MIKTRNTTKKQLNLGIQTNKTTENKFNNKKIVNKVLSPIENIANHKNYNYSDSSDSSLELCNMYHKSKQKNIMKFNLMDDSDTDLMYMKSEEKIKLKNSQKNISFINNSTSSNESFKSTKSYLSTSKNINDSNQSLKNDYNNSTTSTIHNYNSDQNSAKKISKLHRKYTTNIQDKLLNCQNDHNITPNEKHVGIIDLTESCQNDHNITPNEKHVGIIDLTESCQNDHNITPNEKHVEIFDLTESAKLLDRIYGKKWRNIDGVIKKSKIKNLNSELDENIKSELYGENILNTSKIQSKKTNYLEKDFETQVNDTSIIFENLDLSDNSNSLIDNQLNNRDHQVNHENSNQLNINDCINIKPITKFKILNEISDKKKKDIYSSSSQSKISNNLNAKLSFLSSLSCFTGSMQCDPEAEKYKLKFKKNKDDLLSVLFKLFNKEVFDNKLPTDMNFKWNARLRKTAGACFNKRSVKITELLDCERVSRIELSSKVIDTAERLRDTLIHELCHAATWIFNGIPEGHGPSWKSWANKAMQRFPELPIIKRLHSYDIQTKFTYKCIKCGYSIGRHSKSLNLEKKRCGYCYGQFELIANKNNSKADNKLPIAYVDPLTELYNLDNVQNKPCLPKKPSKFALFVKENYKRVKRENLNLKHGEIMKLLGSQFSVTKTLTPDDIFDKLLDN